MTRRRGSETPQRTSRGTGSGEPPGLADPLPIDSRNTDGVSTRRRTIIVREQREVQHSEDCMYEYKQDQWERSPKTDYTYSRSESYTRHATNDGKESPNMSRRSLYRELAGSSSGVSSAALCDLHSKASLETESSTQNWQQSNSTMRMSESRSFGSRHNHRGSNGRSSLDRVGTSTQTSLGGHYRGEMGYEGGFDVDASWRGARVEKVADENYASGMHLQHLHGLDEELEVSDSRKSSSLRVKPQPSAKQKELTWWQYFYQYIVTTVTTIIYGEETRNKGSRNGLQGSRTEGSYWSTPGVNQRAGSQSQQSLAQRLIERWRQWYSSVVKYLSTYKQSNRQTDGFWTDHDFEVDLPDDETDSHNSSTAGTAVHELSSRRRTARTEGAAGYVPGAAAGGAEGALDEDEGAHGGVWWRRLDTRLVKHFSTPPKGFGTEDLTGGSMYGSYGDVDYTKRRRRGVATAEATKPPSVWRSVYVALLNVLKVLLMIPVGFVFLCWRALQSIAKLPGLAAGSLGTDTQNLVSGVAGTSVHADAYVLSRFGVILMTSEVRRRHGCCASLLFLFLIPLILAGSYYTLACGGLGAAGFLPSNESTIYQFFYPTTVIIERDPTFTPPVITPPCPDPGSSVTSGLTLAALDSRIQELFPLLYAESSEKTQLKFQGDLAKQRGEIKSDIGKLEMTLIQLSQALAALQAGTGVTGKMEEREEPDVGELRILVQSEMKVELDKILLAIERLKEEQKKFSDSTAAARIEDEAATKIREATIQKSLYDYLQKELSGLQLKLTAITADKGRDSTARLEEELAKLQAQLNVLLANQNQPATTAAALDPKYVQMIEENKNQISALLISIKRLEVATEQAKTQQSSPDGSVKPGSIGLQLTEAELTDRIKQLTASLALEVKADQQKLIDRQGEELRRSLSALETRLTAVTVLIDGRTGSESGASSIDYTRFQKDIEEINLTLRDLRGQIEGLDERFSRYNSRIQRDDDKASMNAAAIAGLEARLLNLTAGNTRLNEAYDQLLLRMSNCCSTPAALNTAIREGIDEYMKLVMGGGTGDSKASAFALWLGSQLSKSGDIDKKLEVMADNLHKQFTEGQKSLKEELSISLSSQGGAAAAGGSHSVDKLSTTASREEILMLIREQLLIYDADKTGKFDFALESAGGSVVSVRCTNTHMPRTGLYSVFGVPLWYTSNSPRVTIQPGIQPGECWAFEGSEGFLVVAMSSPLIVRDVSIEHIPKSLSPTGRIDSAPKNFTVWSLQEEFDKNPILIGNFTYDESRNEPLQTFKIKGHDDLVSKMVELKIHSNQGHAEYTCLYRFRVHGSIAYPSV